MPVERSPSPIPGVLLTTAWGTVTDEQVVSYYRTLLEQPRSPWLEIVDGMTADRMLLTVRAIARICDLFALHRHALHRVRTALIAPPNGVVSGVLRVWQAGMQVHGLEARLFEEFDAAETWLLDGAFRTRG